MKQKFTSRSPIGVFDSGIGGLTVAKSIFRLLPNENIIYLGDSARLPYGTKSKETIILYSIECLKFLLKKKVKLIVIACNTSSAISVPFLSKITTVPVLGVINPGASAATQTTKNHKIGVIGTRATINSEAYQKQIKKLDKKAKVFSQNCSLFVQLAEDGWTDNEIAELTAKEYLTDIKKSGIDTMILGCTHYPILRDTIQKTMGAKINLIDPGEETAKEVKKVLSERNLLNKQKKNGYHKFFVTDFPVNFKSISERFLGKKISEIKKVKLT
ncbi:MAG: glutamate racemase [Ignavibacteriae bacterium]|nr:glutamate racemase [Ignavibacteriota bacterium]MCB9242964.1 glutamate racemase [Ignavibacteriales bacterium]